MKTYKLTVNSSFTNKPASHSAQQPEWKLVIDGASMQPGRFSVVSFGKLKSLTVDDMELDLALNYAKDQDVVVR